MKGSCEGEPEPRERQRTGCHGGDPRGGRGETEGIRASTTAFSISMMSSESLRPSSISRHDQPSCRGRQIAKGVVCAAAELHRPQTEPVSEPGARPRRPALLNNAGEHSGMVTATLEQQEKRALMASRQRRGSQRLVAAYRPMDSATDERGRLRRVAERRRMAETPARPRNRTG